MTEASFQITKTNDDAGTAGPDDGGMRPRLHRGLGLYDSTMIVAGSMIGSGIFIVAGQMARETGSAGWMMVSWLIAGLLTVSAALSYGELAAMMPRAGGQYVYLREAFTPMWGFLYGWTLFLVIQTGTIAASSVGFSRYLGVLWGPISESQYIVEPIHLGPKYAISLSTAQVVSLLIIALLTFTNSKGLKYGKGIQNVFTTVKIGSLAAVILIGVIAGWGSHAAKENLLNAWKPVSDLGSGISGPLTAFGILVALSTSQIGSLFAADAWNNITFSAGEVRKPSRNLPLSLLLGTASVIGLYTLANFAYALVLPFSAIQHTPSDRVAAAMMEMLYPNIGALVIAIAIMVAAFGCMNGMILSGARAYYAMALDGLFFKKAGMLNRESVPSAALTMQGLWAGFLVLLRTYNPVTKSYGNLYGDLLDYVVSAALLFYILTIAGVFRLRKTQPDAERPYRAFGYPVIPALYIAVATAIFAILMIYRPTTTVPGIVIVAMGMPVYLVFRRNAATRKHAIESES